MGASGQLASHREKPEEDASVVDRDVGVDVIERRMKRRGAEPNERERARSSAPLTPRAVGPAKSS